MAAIPITLNVVAKVRNQWEKTDREQSYNVMDHPPAKYNDKLMNSIWGLYNQYAPPSFQKNYEKSPSPISAPVVTLGEWRWKQSS